MFGVEALLATRGLAGSLRRTSVLVGALSTALAMLVAVGIMVGSFRETVLVWMDDRLQADLYLRPAGPAGNGPASDHVCGNPAAIWRKLPEVEAIDTLRAYEISYQGLPVTLGGMEASWSRTLRQSPAALRRAASNGVAADWSAAMPCWSASRSRTSTTSTPATR